MPPDTEVEVGATPDKAIEDTIRETLRDINSRGDSSETNTPEASAPESEVPVEGAEGSSAAAAAATGRTRGPDGKFAKAPSGGGESGPSGIAVQPETKPHDTYPSSWKKDHETTWKALPESVRAEVHRREQDFLNGIKEYKEPAAFGKALAADLLPHLDTFRRLNTTPQNVVREVMGTWNVLVNGNSEQKRQALLQVAKNYGIDLPAGVAPSPQIGAQPPANGIDFSPVTQRIEGIEQALQAQRAESERIAQERVDSEIDAFGKDPKHEHFAAVRQEMGRNIQSGSANTLQEAYDKAVWALPETRAKLLEKETQERSKRQAEEAAAARKAASANVTRRGTPPAVQKPGSMEDTIRNEYRRLTAEG